MKIFKKDHYNKLMGVEKEPEVKLKFKEDVGSSEERAAFKYANEPTGLDNFNIGEKLLMRAAFLAGVKWAKKNRKTRKSAI